MQKYTLKEQIKDNFYLRWIQYQIKYVIPWRIKGDRRLIEEKYMHYLGYKPDLDNPKRLNEKLQWLKLHDRRPFCTMCVDKYRVREYLKKNFGEQYTVPVVFQTEDWRKITPGNLPDYPCVVKANTGSGTWRIIRDKNEVNFKELRNKCRRWMYLNQYYRTQEWQYKNVKPCIIVEKLLTDKDGKIPNDVKLHYFNGELAFVYCVIDREGENYRALFTRDWELLPFQWVSDAKYKKIDKPVTEPRPANLDKMIEFGDRIAKNFRYVRVDFYELDGRMYFSEITLQHGAGYNKFHPAEYEKTYAELLKL